MRTPDRDPIGLRAPCSHSVRLEVGAPLPNVAPGSTELRRAGLGRAGLGRAGERLALVHLADVHGLVPVATNLRVAVEDLRGELDVVMRDPRSAALVVCEVKTRSGHGAGGSLNALGPRQQARIRRMTAYLLASGRLCGRTVRFDLITVDVEASRSGAAARLGHVPDAW